MAGSRPSESRQPRLSVSMIVRNEALRLPGFLDALADLAEEVCVTDTGSEDGTPEIAEARGCRVRHFPWCGDFAAARNAALQPCTGLWILSLDADELIAPEDHGTVRALTEGPRDRCYRFVTRNYTRETTALGFVWSPPDTPHTLGFPGWFPSGKVRLFPNLSGIAFEEPVHELIHRSLERQGVQVVNTAVPVHHYPLLNQSPDARARKQALYLELGQQKVARSPDDPMAHHELGDQYVDLGDYAQALRCYKEAVRLDPGNPAWIRDLGGALLLLGHLASAEQALALSVQLGGDDEDAWRNLGVARARQENWPGARDAFQHAHAINSEHPENQRYLAIALQACGDRDGALVLLEGLLERYPTHREGRALYTALVGSPNGS
ncbi:MAG: tetratricopeptide repeat protein [Candidatus Hydrogenedentes bacterium]|nr:tetratricopeptide repeat protein [Candidatus Hydrogenedentota bacterium]